MEAQILAFVFTDLVGSTSLLSRVGEVEAERVRVTHFGVLRDAAGAHHGVEVKNLGDGLMLTFNSVAEAAAAAIAVQRGISRHNRSAAVPLLLRIGLSVGEPVAREGDYFGLPVVEASRLCAAAQGGQILATAQVEALLASRPEFRFQSAGELNLRGLARPVQAWLLESDAGAAQDLPLPPALLAEPRAPFVGRASAMSALRAAWEAAERGSVQTVLLAGEAGIGKTRLVRECTAELHPRGVQVLYGRADEFIALPYQAMREAVEFVVRTAPAESVQAAVRASGPAIRTLLPAADDVPVVPLSENPVEAEAFLIAAATLFLSSLAEARPTVLVLEDLHWADRGTLLLLRHLGRIESPLPLLLVGTYRDTDIGAESLLHSVAADLARTGRLTPVALGGLAGEEVEALLTQLLPDLAPDAGGLSARLREWTDGNPFFVEQVLQGAGADSGPAPAGLTMPTSVKDVVGQRISRLSPPCRELLACASVVGMTVRVPELVRIVELDEDAVLDAVDEATAGGLLRSQPAGGYRFAHALVREALYAALPPGRRARLHRRVGEALESMPAADRWQAATLAHHFLEAADAGDGARAVSWVLEAVTPMIHGGSHHAALVLLDRALALLPAEDVSVQTIWRLHFNAGLASFFGGDTDAAGRRFQAALELAESHGLDDEAAQSVLARSQRVGVFDATRFSSREAELLELAAHRPGVMPATQARLLARLSAEYWRLHDIPAQRASAAEAEVQARLSGDLRALAAALLARSDAQGYDDLAAKTRLDREVHSLAPDAESAVPPRVEAAHKLLGDLLRRGDLAAYEEVLEDTAAYTRDFQWPYHRMTELLWRATLEAVRGDMEAASRLNREAGAMTRDWPLAVQIQLGQALYQRAVRGREAHDSAWMRQAIAVEPATYGLAALVAGMSGAPADTLGLVDSGVAALDQIRVSSNSLMGIGQLAEACGWVDAPAAAARLHTLLVPHEDEVLAALLPWTCHGPVQTCIAGACISLERFAEAAERLEAALGVASAMPFPAAEAAAAVLYARMLGIRRSPGDAARAGTLLQRAAALAERHALGLAAAAAQTVVTGPGHRAADPQ